MLKRVLEKLRQKVVWVLVVALLLLATYVSIGREFMPVVSRYADFFEDQIAAITGLPVNVDSLTGDFQGFNPSVRLNGLRILVDADPDSTATNLSSALEARQAFLEIDVMRSIWQRRWVFGQFLVEGLALEVEQTEEGRWQLHDVNLSGAGDVDPAALYQALLRVARLDLRDVQVNLTTRNRNSIQIANGSAVIQNRRGNHYLHVNAGLENSSEMLALSVEVRGGSLDVIDGTVHLRVPDADYSNLLAGESFGQVSVESLTGGAEFWMQFADGELREITARLALGQVGLGTNAGVTIELQDIAGIARLQQEAATGKRDLMVRDMQLAAGELQWAPFNAHLAVRGQQDVTLRADLVDMTFLNQLALRSGIMSEAVATRLSGYDPRGELTNLVLYWPLSTDAGQAGSVQANLRGVELGSVNGSPSLRGLDGYIEAAYDVDTRIARGFGEVESNRFGINIPSVFVDTWEYDYVNGRLDFYADLNDGQHITMVSSPVVARSASLDGRLQFASSLNRYADGRRAASLDLLAGALTVDAAQKSPYLPNAPAIAPGLRRAMQWLNGALQDGNIKNSGLIFRGSTLPGSAAITRTFQSFYSLQDGVVSFSEDWPLLTGLSGVVYTNDDKIDVLIDGADSMGIAASEVSAQARRNAVGENWLDITGKAAAATSSGLAYLQEAPVGQDLRDAIQNWEATGDFSADITVRVPLNIPDANTDVRLDVAVENNSLLMPDYAMNITDLSGPVVFDTRTGIEPSELQGKIFGRDAAIKLSSLQNDRQLQNILVSASSKATPAELIEWPLQSRFVRQLLADLRGEFDYSATVNVRQTGDPGTTVTIDTTLQGAALTLPGPFAKTAASSMPLHLEIGFDAASQNITGTLGEDIELSMRLSEGSLQDGLLLLGDVDASLREQAKDTGGGLAVLGQVDHLKVESWIEYLTGSVNSRGNANSAAEAIAYIDIMVDSLEIYQQLLPEVGVRIESNPATGYWDIDLNGDAVSGEVNVPIDSADYLRLTLAHLRLPGPESEVDTATKSVTENELADAAPATEEVPEERVDVLAGIDPRALPKMQVAAGALSIGERSYGAWRFTLDPVTTGVEISNLAFDFRGLRMGDIALASEETGADGPHFSWYFDGVNHRSELQGQVTAVNMADVLTANGIAPSLNSSAARFETDLSWPGSPAFFAGAHLSGEILMDIDDGRFEQVAGSSGALKLISIINFDAIMRRLRFSDDLLRRGLAYDSIDGNLALDDGQVQILDRLVISGPSSLYQITGELNLAEQTINGEMYLTLPVSANIPWLGLLTANIPLAVGAYLFDRIFGDQVNNLTSAVYTLAGPWEGLEPEFKQAFGSPDSAETPADPAPVQ